MGGLLWYEVGFAACGVGAAPRLAILNYLEYKSSSADPSCGMFLLQLEKHVVLRVLLACNFFPLHQHPIVYTVAQNKKWGVFCLFVILGETEEIMGKRVVCQKQFKSTSQCLPAKESTLCWAYSGVSFQDDSGDDCSNLTNQSLPHISSSQAAESPAGTNRKRAQLAGWCQRAGSPLAVHVQQTRTDEAVSRGRERSLAQRLRWRWLSRILRFCSNYMAWRTVLFPSSYLVCAEL